MKIKYAFTFFLFLIFFASKSDIYSKELKKTKTKTRCLSLGSLPSPSSCSSLPKIQSWLGPSSKIAPLK
jgi:hypothetical protein